MQSLSNLSTFDRIMATMPALLDGALITFELTILATIIGTFLGLFLALGRLSKGYILTSICRSYIWLVRGTPLLMQIYVIYYMFPLISKHLSFDSFTCGVIALGLNSAAYLAEIFRAAILSIDKGQMEAGKALGLSYRQTMRRIIIPQSYRRLMPPVGNEFIMLLKDSSLVSIMGLTELLRVATTVSNKMGNAWIYLPAAALYLLMTTFFSFIFAQLEKKYSVYE